MVWFLFFYSWFFIHPFLMEPEIVCLLTFLSVTSRVFDDVSSGNLVLYNNRLLITGSGVRAPRWSPNLTVVINGLEGW